MRGIYIHIPFCIKKCPYCAFNSYSNMESIMGQYKTAVISEILSYENICADTLYIGGGTPTTMPPHMLYTIITTALKHFNIAGGSEVTIEANPKTINKEFLINLKNSGVNRISLGVQSLNSKELENIGRGYTGADALAALDIIQSAGFTNFSVDVMFALPYQTIGSLNQTINTLLTYNPPHFSAYSLSIDPGTHFYARPPAGLPNEDAEREMYSLLADALKGAGYRHYEISNFAKPGAEAVHNTKYWLGREYIGIGAGAASYYMGKRFENPQNPAVYIQNPFKRENAVLIDQTEKAKEHYILGLRLLDGVDELYHENLETLMVQGLIYRKNKKICLTPRGIDLANYVMEQLM